MSRSRPIPTSHGGLLQAIEFLNEKKTGRKEILIFSDMKEELDKGYVGNIPLDFKGFEVVALNVNKLRSDNFDPREYLRDSKPGASRSRKAAAAERVITTSTGWRAPLGAPGRARRARNGAR